MKGKRTKNIILNERDRKLFNYLYEVKVANARQICRDIFCDVTKTVFYRRVNKLIGMNYIKICPYFDGKSILSGFSLSKKALHKFILGEKNEELTKRCLSDCIEHDIVLVDIRHRLMKCFQVQDYFSENLIKSYSPLVRDINLSAFREVSSDGIVFIKKDDKVFRMAVEYEHSLKYTDRYSYLFRRYYYHQEIDMVLYICRDSGILKRVMPVEAKAKEANSPKVFFALIDDVLSSENCLKFYSPCGKELSIN